MASVGSPALFMPSPEALGALPESLRGTTHFNLSGDYTYLTTGYYTSLDAELQGLSVLPTTADALDAYVVPIAMEKARLHGIATPEYAIVTDKLTAPPILAYPINPFSSRCELITEGADLGAKFKALSMTGKYAVICQTLPLDYRVDVVRCILGRSLVTEYAAFARQIFEAFRLPLVRARVIVTASAYLLSALEPLPSSALTLNEKKLLGTWQK